MSEQPSLSAIEIESLDIRLREAIRTVKDFPRDGINFKDITPVLQDSHLCREILQGMLSQVSHLQFDAVAGIESRGFIFGILLAQALDVPFVLLRKKGKLPYKTLHQDYSLEYGQASLEVHIDALPVGARVLIHDDLLATGGTVEAACRLIAGLGAKVEACIFILSLSFLEGTRRLNAFTSEIHSLVDYNT